MQGNRLPTRESSHCTIELKIIFVKLTHEVEACMLQLTSRLLADWVTNRTGARLCEGAFQGGLADLSQSGPPQQAPARLGLQAHPPASSLAGQGWQSWASYSQTVVSAQRTHMLVAVPLKGPLLQL